MFIAVVVVVVLVVIFVITEPLRTKRRNKRLAFENSVWELLLEADQDGRGMTFWDIDARIPITIVQFYPLMEDWIRQEKVVRSEVKDDSNGRTKYFYRAIPTTS